MSTKAIPRRTVKKNPRIPLKATSVAAASLAAGLIFGSCQTATTTPAATPEPTPITVQASGISTGIQSGTLIADSLVSTTYTLLDGQIALGLEEQQAIWDLCHQNKKLFSTVLAIANRETGFNVLASGDNGSSLGLMQIHTYWQQDRIDALGVTDLLDYQQNVTVAVDYLDWIAERLCPESPEDAYGTNEIFMAYNQGWAGAQKDWASGVVNTTYSQSCMAYYQSYIDSMGVTP